MNEAFVEHRNKHASATSWAVPIRFIGAKAIAGFKASAKAGSDVVIGVLLEVSNLSSSIDPAHKKETAHSYSITPGHTQLTRILSFEYYTISKSVITL